MIKRLNMVKPQSLVVRLPGVWLLCYREYLIEFVPLLEYNKRAYGGMNMEYLTSNEIALRWDISSRRVRKLCGEGRVAGAVQKGNLWLIPDNSQKPEEFQRGRKKQVDAKE